MACQRMMVGLLYLLLLLAACSDGEKDRLKVTKCTGSNVNDPFRNVSLTDIYYNIVHQESLKSCMHFAWSTVAYPTLYLAYTSNNKSCVCNASMYNNTYPVDQDNTVYIPGQESEFSLAIVFRRLIEFDATDKDYTVEKFNTTEVCNDNLEDNSSYTTLPLKSFLNWTFNEESGDFTGNLHDAKNFAKPNGSSFTIRTKIPEFAGEDRLKYFPKTLFTENSTTFDFIIENFFLNSAYNNRRLALEVMIVHGENVRNGSINIKKTVDDEYTPSVFSTYTYMTSGKNDTPSNRGYVQWKPISYLSSKRKSTSSQQVTILPAGSSDSCQVENVPEGLASALFGKEMTKTSNITRWFVVFGTSGDTFVNSDYNTWTAVVGCGDVPKDRFSAEVIITILVGLGVPAALVVVAGVYVFIKKKPWKKIQGWINNKSGRGYSRIP